MCVCVCVCVCVISANEKSLLDGIIAEQIKRQ